jgi:L-fuconolactonase
MKTVNRSPALIIDSHLHLVDLDRFRYYWMKPEFTILHHNFLAEDVRPIYEAHNVVRSVLVQAHPSSDETRYLVETAKRVPFIGAVIAHVDLTAETVEDDLGELSRLPFVRGVRHQRAEDEPARWFLKPEVIRGLRAVSQAGLIYDLLAKPQHLSSIPPMMQKVPDLRIVLEHMGKPPISSGSLQPWGDDLAAVAANPSVHCKISELVTQADWETWNSDDLKPYVHHALECFGAQRLMWGSGWPVCLLAADFERTLTSALDALGPVSEPELDFIFKRTAQMLYGLDV